MRRRLTACTLLGACALALLAPLPASAQLGRTRPGQSYFLALEQLYEANYRRATRGLQNEARTAIRTVTTRWIDSICYFTWLGEALSLQGRHAEALEQLDLAAELFLLHADWLDRVQFQQPPRINDNLARRRPPWARPARAAVYADTPDSVLVAIGQVDNNAEVQRGGVVRLAQFWRLDAQEVARSTTWMIRRRGLLLGPLAEHDRLQRTLTDTLSRGGMAPPNHWSSVWVELWQGAAAASTGDAAAATPHLDRALTLEGRYDHALTGLAALVKADLALAAGDPAAGDLLVEAIYAAVAYDDFAVVSEAVAALPLAAAMHDVESLATLYEGVADWAARRGRDHPRIVATLGAAESALANRQPDSAEPLLAAAFARAREAEAGPLGADALRLRAILATRSADADTASTLAARAVAAQAAVSLRNFQIALAARRFDTGDLPRTAARDVFARLLGDPPTVDRLAAPLDTAAALRTDHSAALDRWLAAATKRRKADEAAAVGEAARRRRWFGSQTLGGRLASLRRLLEAEDEALSPAQRQARAALVERWPGYAAAQADERAARRDLDAARGPVDGEAASPAWRDAAEKIDRSADARETLLLEMALSRVPTPLVFPPPAAVAATRAALEPGQAVLAFHQSRGEYHGAVITADGEHAWRIGKAKRVRGEAAALLRSVAGASPQQKWSYDDLASTDWRGPAAELGATLLADSRLDWPATRELIIVPDGDLWRVPFEALLAPFTAGETRLVADMALVTYAPTIGLAIAPSPKSPADGPTAIVGDRPDEAAQADPVAIGAIRVIPPITTPPTSTKTLGRRLVIDERLDIDPGDPFGLTLARAPRREGVDLRAWQRLPYRGPRVVVLADLHTAAERAGKPDRRTGRDARHGDELFFTACGLLAGGRPTALVTRWTTDGARARELVAEWLVGLDRATPAEAWRRSVGLARAARLEAPREPRVEPPDKEGLATPPDASHPFFWAGFLLLD